MRNCEIARKLGVVPLNVRRAIKRFQELGHSVTVREAAENTTRNCHLIKRRVQRNSTVSNCLCEKLPVQPVTRENRRVQLLNWEHILLTDLKLFTIEQAQNLQNDRSGAPRFPARQLSASTAKIPVWAVICDTGTTPLVFINEEVKVD